MDKSWTHTQANIKKLKLGILTVNCLCDSCGKQLSKGSENTALSIWSDYGGIILGESESRRKRLDLLLRALEVAMPYPYEFADHARTELAAAVLLAPLGSTCGGVPVTESNKIWAREVLADLFLDAQVEVLHEVQPHGLPSWWAR